MQVIIDVNLPADLELLRALAQRLGLPFEVASEDQEDAALLKAMKLGMSTERVSREEVMKALRQNEG